MQECFFLRLTKQSVLDEDSRRLGIRTRLGPLVVSTKKIDLFTSPLWNHCGTRTYCRRTCVSTACLQALIQFCDNIGRQQDA
jgi:hypothetical protein